MKIFSVLTFLLFSKVACSQEIVYVEKFYRFSFNNNSLVGRVVYMPKDVKFKDLWTLKYSKDWKKNAIDSAQKLGGNVLKVVYNKRDGATLKENDIEKVIKFNNAGYVANIYKLNENDFLILKDSVKKLLSNG
jgi:hypothetical protein